MIIDNHTKNKIVNYMPTSDIVSKLGDLFDICSDITRLKIISMLLITSMCVSDISEMCQLNQTTVSHQLKTLKTAGFVTSHRQGKVVFYSIKNNKVGELLLSGVEYLGY